VSAERALFSRAGEVRMGRSGSVKCLLSVMCSWLPVAVLVKQDPRRATVFHATEAPRAGSVSACQQGVAQKHASKPQMTPGRQRHG